MNPDKFLKPQEDEESFLIKLKLDSEENIEFLNKMRTKQFPKEITAVEISGFNVNFIKEKWAKFDESAKDAKATLTAE